MEDKDFEVALDVSRYATQLDAWRRWWPRERFLPLVYEDLVRDPGGVVEGVQRFLGLSPVSPGPDLTVTHNTRTDMAADQALAGVLDRAPWLEPVRRWVPATVLRAVRGVVGTLRRHDVRLTEAERARAKAELGPEAERVREEWGVDTSRWDSLR